MTLTISGPMAHANGSIEINEASAERARIGFNPSSNDRVARIKTLAAALYTELDAIIDDAEGPGSRGPGSRSPGSRDTAQREAATAATHIQAGAMFAVSAATAHL